MKRLHHKSIVWILDISVSAALGQILHDLNAVGRLSDKLVHEHRILI